MSDLRDSLRPEEPPAYWEYRLGRFVRTLWRIAIVAVVVVVLGAVADLLGLI